MRLIHKYLSARSDENLMSLLANGGQSAFDELYKRYSRPMLNFFYRLLDRDRERAEDMLHDLFLKIIEKPEFYDDSKSFRAWFYTLAGNMVRNEYRSRQVSNDYERNVTVQPEQLTDGPEVALDRKLFERQLQSEIDRFDPEQNMLFQLRFVEEMAVRQIAEILECPEGTVKSRLFHLTRQLAKKLSMYKPI